VEPAEACSVDRPEGLPQYRLRTSQAISETATRVSSKESTYAAACRGYKSVDMRCPRPRPGFPHCLCRCRSPAPACRCRPGAHCCVFATSRRTVAIPATASVGRDRLERCPGTDWSGLIRATTEAVSPAPGLAPQGCPCIAPPVPKRSNRLPGRTIRGAMPFGEQALRSFPHRSAGAVRFAEAHRIGSGPSVDSGFPARRLRCIGAFRPVHTPRGVSASHSTLPPTLCARPLTRPKPARFLPSADRLQGVAPPTSP